MGYVQHAALWQVLELVAGAAQFHSRVKHRVVPHAAGAVDGDELLHRHIFPQHHPGGGDVRQGADMAAFRNDGGQLRRAVVRQLRQTIMEPEKGQPGRVREDHPLLALRHRRSILRAADDGADTGIVQQLGSKAGVLQKGEHSLRTLGIAEAQGGKFSVPENLFSWETFRKVQELPILSRVLFAVCDRPWTKHAVNIRAADKVIAKVERLKNLVARSVAVFPGDDGPAKGNVAFKRL